MSRATFAVPVDNGFEYDVTPEIKRIARTISGSLPARTRLSYLAESHRLTAASLEAQARYWELGGDDNANATGYVVDLRRQRDEHNAAADHAEHLSATGGAQ